ncbi:MAG: hypothetical protein KAH18_02770 [Psychromonas sp.]|nr:hypothetical protein [Psychromonas sp.]
MTIKSKLADFFNLRSHNKPTKHQEICILFREYGKPEPIINISKQHVNDPSDPDYWNWATQLDYEGFSDEEQESKFNEHEKILLRQAVMGAIDYSEDAVIAAADVDCNEGKTNGNQLNYNGQRFSEEKVCFKNHMESLKNCFGSNSVDTQLHVKEALNKIHAILTDDTEIITFYDIRNKIIYPNSEYGHVGGYPIPTPGIPVYVGKYLLQIRSDAHYRALMIYRTILKEVLTTSLNNIQGCIICKATHCRNITMKDPDQAILHLDRWVNFVASCIKHKS